MEKLSALSRGTQIMLGAGVLLLIATFLPWQEYDGPGSEFAEALGVEFSRNAWHGLGWVMGLALILLLAWLIARVAGVDLPSLPVSETVIAIGLAAIVFLCALILNLVDDYSTIWSYIGVLLAAAVAFGAWMQLQAAGGVESLKSEMGTMRSSSTAAPPPTTTTTPDSTPAPPPAQTSPPPAEPPPASTDPTH